MDFNKSTDLAEQVPLRKEGELPELRDLRPSETLPKQEIPDWLKEYLPDFEKEELKFSRSDELPELDELKPQSKLETPPDWLEELKSPWENNDGDFVPSSNHRYIYDNGDSVTMDKQGRVEEIEFQPVLDEWDFESEYSDDAVEQSGDNDAKDNSAESGEIQTVEVENEADIPEPAEPNTRYELANGDSITTDAQGRVIEKVFTPELTSDKRTSNDNSKTQEVGKEGKEGDQGGHIQAHRLGGSSDRTNLFPQNENFNKGAYKAMENKVSNALKEGKDVGKVTVRLSYDDDKTTRPSTVEVSYTIDGKQTVQTFKNEEGGGLNDQRTANT